MPNEPMNRRAQVLMFCACRTSDWALVVLDVALRASVRDSAYRKQKTMDLRVNLALLLVLKILHY